MLLRGQMEWLLGLLMNWVTHWLSDGSIKWLTDWLIGNYFIVDWLANYMQMTDFET